MTPHLFLCRMIIVIVFLMNKNKIELIIGNLELLIQSLKEEILDQPEKNEYVYEEIAPHLEDYDEIFDPSEEV